MEITPFTDFGNVLKFLTSPTKISMEIFIKNSFLLIRESFFYILWLRANKYGSPNCQFLKLVPPGFRAQKEKYVPLLRSLLCRKQLTGTEIIFFNMIQTGGSTSPYANLRISVSSFFY